MTDERPGDQPDQPSPEAGTTSDAGTEAGEAGGWSTFDPNEPGPGDANGRKILGQLQAMIDSIATQAAPVAKQIGVKAAELTAVAADRAGPFAHRGGGRRRRRERQARSALARAGRGPASRAGRTGQRRGGFRAATPRATTSSTSTAVDGPPADEPPSEQTPGPG